MEPEPYRDLAADAESDLGSALVFLTGPPEDFVPGYLQGKTAAGMALLLAADLGRGTLLRATSDRRGVSPGWSPWCWWPPPSVA